MSRVATRRRDTLTATAGLAVLGAIVLAANASWGRPLWFDEFVHFAMGALPPGFALEVIHGTTGGGINQGQTGVYLLVDYWLLHTFGANLFLLRLPSLLSGALLLVSGVVFLRRKGLSSWWQGVMIIGFAAQGGLMYFAGEARPYMPLAACSVATLAYYQYDIDDRRALTPRALGFLGLVGGALVHPYFALMGVAAAGFSIWELRYSRGQRMNADQTVAFLNPWLIAPAITLFFIVGGLTWMTGRPDDRHDPWELLGGLGNGVEAFLRSHTELLQPITIPLVVTMSVGVAFLALIVRRIDRRTLLPPLMLVAVAFASSMIISMLSIQGHYWVIPRQWVAGIAFASVGVVWLLGASWNYAVGRSVAAVVLIGGFTGLIVAAGALATVRGVSTTVNNSHTWSTLVGSDEPSSAWLDADPRNGDWVDLANRNVAAGGPVWPLVSEFYVRMRIDQ